MGKRWDRSQYPVEWEEISYRFRASKNFTCEVCGRKQGTPFISKAGKERVIIVDAAHKYSWDVSNPNAELYCLCKACHRLYDNKFKEGLEELEHLILLHRILLQKRRDAVPV